MAKFYDVSMRKVEERCLGAWRSELLGEVSGDVLEIGSGTGVNLPYYPNTVKRLVLSEPDSNMRKQLQQKVSKLNREHISITQFSAESIDFPDASFDCVVSTLVLCSVTDQPICLREFRRVLRPGGKLVFLEHVAAEQDLRLYHWQKFFEPLWTFMGCNCHLTRNTESEIRQAGFNPVLIDRVSMEGAPPVVRPVIKGVAQTA